MEGITKAIKDRMFELGVSFCEIARRTGIHRTTVGTYVNHPERCPLGALRKIVDALNMDWDWFWTQEVFDA